MQKSGGQNSAHSTLSRTLFIIGFYKGFRFLSLSFPAWSPSRKQAQPQQVGRRPSGRFAVINGVKETVGKKGKHENVDYCSRRIGVRGHIK